MANFNRIIIIGNLTRDPEYNQLPSGQGLCKLGIASNRQYRNKATGEMVSEVCFVDVTVWGAQAESCNQYLQKGRPILVEGRLKLDTWKDQEGNNRSKHTITAERVVFLGSRQDAEAGQDSGYQAAPAAPAGTAPAEPATQAAPAAAPEGAFKDEAPFSDELPF